MKLFFDLWKFRFISTTSLALRGPDMIQKTETFTKTNVTWSPGTWIKIHGSVLETPRA